MEKYECPLISMGDRIRRDLQKYETACLHALKTSTVTSLLEELVKDHSGEYRDDLRQALLFVSKVLKSERRDIETIKECLLYGKELPNHL